MSAPRRIATLLNWCLNNGVTLDSRLRLLPDEKDGIKVFSLGHVPPLTTGTSGFSQVPAIIHPFLGRLQGKMLRNDIFSI